ncbi:class I adenylate-forming enzyme family protein [Nocardioides abyssi]|uniref:AMP-binding protein n=1 Tax=Nocardioides abyssi TaxID=3058370 RepID=A0ABT8EZI2_9ACTN|nr:AMP-binding protein [Nocardioides abyssi]MDN4163454.1 AMP-binding protein [Nocardioides abyssi]
MSAPTLDPQATGATTQPGEHNLAVLAERAFERHGDYEALCFEGQWHTSGSIHERAARVAGGLRRIGVEVGDRVVVLMMNTPEVFVTYRAVWRAGAVVTPVLFLQSPPELRHILTDSGARAVVVTPELLPLLQSAAEGLDLEVLVVGEEDEPTPGTRPYAELETADPLPIEPRADDDLAALLYTGGTTGRAKGVMLSHRGLWESGAGIDAVARTMDSTRSLLPLPLSHAYGLIVVVGGMHADRRGVSVLQRWFDAKGWLELVQEHRLESSPVVPSMLTMLLAEPLDDYDLSCLQSFGSGGAPLPAALREEVEGRLGVVILEGYGCTESSAVISASTMDARRPGSVGRPLPHAEVAILDPTGQPVPVGEDGEICVRGPGVMLGYWNEPELTAQTVVDGWLHTGDIGHLDDDGYLYVVDRVKDLIIRGGFNVFPRDVEDALLTHPEVTSAACVGRPDPASGEEVVAVVSVQPGSTLSGEDLVTYAKGRLAAYKYPREVVVVDAVPLTSVGKTDRKAVRALVRG